MRAGRLGWVVAAVALVRCGTPATPPLAGNTASTAAGGTSGSPAPQATATASSTGTSGSTGTAGTAGSTSGGASATATGSTGGAVSPAWSLLGGPVAEADFIQVPVVAVEPSGAPVVAWIGWEGQSVYRVHVSRWDGQGWSPLGGGPGLASSNQSLQLALWRGQPVVAWSEPSGASDSRIALARWDGSAWQRLPDPPGASAALSMQVALAEDPAGGLAVAWSTLGTDAIARTWVVRWDGAAYRPLASLPVSPHSRALSLALAVDHAGSLVLATGAGTSDRGWLEVRRWDGAAWLSLGQTQPTPIWSRDVALAVDGGDRLVAFWAQVLPAQAYCNGASLFDGQAWSPPDFSSCIGNDGRPALAIGAGGQAVRAYSTQPMHSPMWTTTVNVDRWDGTGWRPELTGLPGGWSALAADAAGRPVLVSVTLPADPKQLHRLEVRVGPR